MKESDIEAYVRRHVEGRLVKWVSPGETGVPDRILLLPGGRVIFIEFKKPGGRLSERQLLWIDRLKVLGHDVRVIGSMDEARRFVDEIRSKTIPK
jgi:hypothetical protein